jgi:DNA (cytosine-5)-methyltransferase 1
MTFRIMDTFCKAGGAGMGYHLAGFEVVGVDIEPQKNYPFEFHQADALEYITEHGHEFDAIHASPKCQDNCPLKHRWGKSYENQIPAVRRLLQESGKPYIIENVEGAKRRLQDPLVLCGTMFGLKVIRHRLFENNIGLIFPPFTCQCKGKVGKRGHLGDREFMTVTGHFSNIEKARAAMGIDWMNQEELAQAIPPAYTTFIGEQLIAYLENVRQP